MCKVDRIHKRLWIVTNLVPVPGDSQLEQNSQYLVNQSTSGKMMHMFPSMKKEEYMVSEFSGIFQVKVVTKNIVFGSLGTQHKAALQYDVSFWRNMQIFWTKLLQLSAFLVKQYTRFIYVERMSFCLVNWEFPFPREPFHAGKLQRYFMHMGIKESDWIEGCNIVERRWSYVKNAIPSQNPHCFRW